MTPMTEEEEYRNAGITKEEAETSSKEWIKGYKEWKKLKDKGVISDKVKLKELKKIIEKERCPHN